MSGQFEIIDLQSPVEASAPGSLMLLGEHAVLHGRRALVCAINRRITVSVSSVLEKVLRIDSALGQYESPLDELADHPDFRFVLDAVKQYAPGQGLELKIGSEFSCDIGFGSSAAVTVATHAALIGNVRRKMEVFKRSLATIHRVQGRGSGADVSASVFGGVVAYRANRLSVYPMAETFSLTAVYSGSKMKTADVIQLVEERRALDPEKFKKIFDQIDASVGEVTEDFSCLGKELVANQLLMEEMELSNDALTDIISYFRDVGIPAKISGSGLGDCAIGLGMFPEIGEMPSYSLQVELQGVDINS